MKVELFGPTVHEQDNLENVHVTCSCGEFDFTGDWDDMCVEWFEHTMEPTAISIYETRMDHTSHTFLSRDAAARFLEIKARKRQSLSVEPLEIHES